MLKAQHAPAFSALENTVLSLRKKISFLEAKLAQQPPALAVDIPKPDIPKPATQSHKMRDRGQSYDSAVSMDSAGNRFPSFRGYQSDQGEHSDSSGQTYLGYPERRDSGISFGEADSIALEAEIARLKEENSALKSAQARMQASMEAGEQAGLQEEIRKLKRQVASLHHQNNALAVGLNRRASDASIVIAPSGIPLAPHHAFSVRTPPSTPPTTPPRSLAHVSSAGVDSTRLFAGAHAEAALSEKKSIGRVLSFSPQ